jgi:hypothetical protein
MDMRVILNIELLVHILFSVTLYRYHQQIYRYSRGISLHTKRHKITFELLVINGGTHNLSLFVSDSLKLKLRG